MHRMHSTTGSNSGLLTNVNPANFLALGLVVEEG